MMKSWNTKMDGQRYTHLPSPARLPDSSHATALDTNIVLHKEINKKINKIAR